MQYFDDVSLAALGLNAFDYVERVSAALLAHHQGDLVVVPKRHLGVSSGAYAIGAQGIWASSDLALFHNLVGLDKETIPGQRSTYRSAQVVFRSSDAATLLFVHGSLISSILPVTMGIIGARRFADPSSEKLALVGAGGQGRLNLDAFSRAFPLKQVDIYSRSRNKSNELAAIARDLGLQAQVHDQPQTAITGADIVVSSISESLGIEPFLDVAWLKDQAFVSTVDMLRPWHCSGARTRALLVVDDEAQARDMVKTGRVPDVMPIDATLGGVLAEGASSKDVRPVILLQPGCCASLMGMAAAILGHCKRART